MDVYRVDVDRSLDEFVFMVSHLAMVFTSLVYLVVKEFVNSFIHVLVEFLDVWFLLAPMHRLVYQTLNLTFNEFNNVVLLLGD